MGRRDIMRRSSSSRTMMRYWGILALLVVDRSDGFVPHHHGVIAAFGIHEISSSRRIKRNTLCNMADNNNGINNNEPIFYNDFEGFENEDDDDDALMIDADSLGDWRAFRRNLATTAEMDKMNNDDAGVVSSSKLKNNNKSIVSVSKQNEKLLESQNEKLAREYKNEVWAHETSTPEVGGLVVRMPLEVELRRNHRHSMTGNKLRHKLLSLCRTKIDAQNAMSDSEYIDSMIEPKLWYNAAQLLIEDEMMKIADRAADDGQIDASILNDESAEVLQLYLDNQETWQEVCLVLEKHDNDQQQRTSSSDGSSANTATTVVINRPMALQLTENLAKLVLYGSYEKDGNDTTSMKKRQHYHHRRPVTESVELKDFLRAFGSECAVYVGGPDDQHLPAELIHGVPGLLGATEIAPGIYKGGLAAAVRGVLSGKYKPLEFRFFVGRHHYKGSALDLAVVLGKYQPVACARSLALKQCIQLPKPLWHEVLETCGGELADISRLESLKRDDLRFQIVDEDDDDDDDYDDDDDDDDEYDIVVDLSDDLDELYSSDDDDDDSDEYYTI